jgi:hypothetical protein
MEKFRKFIIEKINLLEKNDKAFSSWLSNYETSMENVNL